MQCFPHEGWWVLHYNGPVRPISAFVDIATQPVVAPGRIEMVDLDLDVVAYADGSVEIVDEDEFAVHQIELGYTTDMVRRARSETELVVDLLWRGQEPFFTVAEGWLEQVATGSFPSQG